MNHFFHCHSTLSTSQGMNEYTPLLFAIGAAERSLDTVKALVAAGASLVPRVPVEGAVRSELERWRK